MRDPLLRHKWQLTRAPLQSPAAGARVCTVAPHVINIVVKGVHVCRAPQGAVVVAGGALPVHLAHPLEGKHTQLSRLGPRHRLTTFKVQILSY